MVTMQYSKNITIKLLTLEDANQFLQLELDNREFFQNFGIDRNPEYYTLDVQKDIINQRIEKAKQDTEYYFGIYKTDNNELIGSIGIFQVQRGPLQRAIVGYSLSQKHNGKGYSTEAVKEVVDYAFNTLQLHRLEAGVMPHNIGSIRVLEKAGFEKEGLTRKNVKINGKWEDHYLFASINPNDCI
jgi:[ribosomal protein S5]-alanine N-acetyltransferase